MTLPVATAEVVLPTWAEWAALVLADLFDGVSNFSNCGLAQHTTKDECAVYIETPWGFNLYLTISTVLPSMWNSLCSCGSGLFTLVPQNGRRLEDNRDLLSPAFCLDCADYSLRERERQSGYILPLGGNFVEKDYMFNLLFSTFADNQLDAALHRLMFFQDFGRLEENWRHMTSIPTTIKLSHLSKAGGL